MSNTIIITILYKSLNLISNQLENALKKLLLQESFFLRRNIQLTFYKAIEVESN